jgi:ABC-type sugar transport systems, permease components
MSQRKIKRVSIFKSVTRRRDLKGLLFMIPWLFGFCMFFAIPLVQSVIFSLNKVVITANGRKMTPVGFENYSNIFNVDIYFMPRIQAFFSGVLLSLPVIIVFSLLIAMLINQQIRGKGLFRAIFFLPIIVVSGPVLQMLIAEGATTIPIIEQYGLFEALSGLPPFLLDPIAALFRQLIMVLWYSGVPILIFLAGLQKADHSLYEAAMIDGASGWVVFWKITLPMLRGMILINAIYTLVFLASSEINDVTLLIRDYMLSPDRGYGIASAMAWAYSLMIVLAIGLIYLLIGREKKDKVNRAQIYRKKGW